MAFLVTTSVHDMAVILASVLGAFLLLRRLKIRTADNAIHLQGGTRAPLLADGFFSVAFFYYQIGKNQSKNNFWYWSRDVLDSVPSGPKHCAEFTLTGGRRVVWTRDPEQIRTVQKAKFSSFGHGERWHKLFKPFLGNGIFATDGQLWQHSRAIIRQVFTKKRIKDLTLFDKGFSKLMAKFDESRVVDAKDLFYRFTFDTITEFLLGENANSLDNSKIAVFEALSTAQSKQMLILALSNLAAFIPKGEYHEAIRELDRFVEPAVARALALEQDELEKITRSDEQFTFLHSIVQQTRDPKQVRDEIMSVFIAGRDTTAATLSWAIYEICGHSTAWSKIRQQVLDALGTEGNPTYDSLKELSYVRNVVNETLRLHPAVPFDMREALETTTIPGASGEPDIVVLKGDIITIHAASMQAREDLYPLESEDFAHHSKFSPERWEHWAPKPWTYIPFHGGPRICIGQDFALTEIAYCLVRLAQRYEKVEYKGDWSAQTVKTDIIATPALPVLVSFHERE